MLNWLVHNSTFNHMLVVELWFSLLYAGYNGAMVVALTEIVPTNIRSISFSFAYGIATAILWWVHSSYCDELNSFYG